MLLLVLKARTLYGIDGHVTFTMSIDMSGNSLPGPVYMPCNPCATASAIHNDDQAHCLARQHNHEVEIVPAHASTSTLHRTCVLDHVY